MEARRDRMLYDVFLSHAGADKPAVKRLANKSFFAVREFGISYYKEMART
jgi:hypothetical protein